MSTFLTDAEVVDVTRRRQPCAQARTLDRMGVPYKRRADGTLLVGRSALEAALSGTPATMVGVPASNGLIWRNSA